MLHRRLLGEAASRLRRHWGELVKLVRADKAALFIAAAVVSIAALMALLTLPTVGVAGTLHVLRYFILDVIGWLLAADVALWLCLRAISYLRAASRRAPIRREELETFRLPDPLSGRDIGGLRGSH